MQQLQSCIFFVAVLPCIEQEPADQCHGTLGVRCAVLCCAVLCCACLVQSGPDLRASQNAISQVVEPPEVGCGPKCSSSLRKRGGQLLLQVSLAALHGR